MEITIEVSNCKECPFYRCSRYGYCSAQYKNDVEAYHAGAYAEYDSELDWLFSRCIYGGQKKD